MKYSETTRLNSVVSLKTNLFRICFWALGCLMINAQTTIPAFCDSFPQDPDNYTRGWQSQAVYYEKGKLTYYVDAEQNRIPDYSYAGYKYGEVALPVVPEVQRLSPESGDQTSRIQAALNEIGQRTPDENGIRGALVLEPGIYEIQGTIHINRTGVVLRGSGNGSDASSSTILRATGDTPHQRNVVILGSGNNSWSEVLKTNITDSFVPVSSTSFHAEDVSYYSAGDYIVVHHPSTQAWINAVDGGGVVDSAPWQAGNFDIVYYRRITRIDGNNITIDAPVYNHLDKSLAQSYIAKSAAGEIREAGVENLRIDIVTKGGDNEDHAWNCLYVQGAHDSWVIDVVGLHFGYAAFRLENAVRFTVANCKGLSPVAVRTGGNMYNFTCDRRAQLVLMKYCEATLGRHSYVSNGVTLASGLVYYRCRQQGGGSEGGHRHWVTGVLYDNITETGDGQVLLINRGDFGTSHGWGTAHSTIWMYNGEWVAQKPPTAQNYVITNAGNTREPWFPGPTGFVEFRPQLTIVPTSLYEAQFCERMSGEKSSDIDSETHFVLNQNYPNPCKENTTIDYTLLKDAFVTLKIYDVKGRMINTLVSMQQDSADYQVPFNTRGLSSGVYFYQLKCDGKVKTKKIIIVK